MKLHPTKTRLDSDTRKKVLSIMKKFKDHYYRVFSERMRMKFYGLRLTTAQINNLDYYFTKEFGNTFTIKEIRNVNGCDSIAIYFKK